MNILQPNHNLASTTKTQPRLRADGNLTYLEFIALVRHLWAKVHPDIPIVPAQGENYAKYPCIVYSLELRKTHDSEPKSRYREERKTVDGEHYLIYGWRFINIVKFTAVTKNKPELCEQVMEMFEDWMDTYTPTFKQLGLSDFFYSRRLPDDEITSKGQDLCTRAVTYMVTTEKIKNIRIETLDEIVVNARIYLDQLGEEFTVLDGDTFLTMVGHEFETGDRVVIVNGSEFDLPGGLHNNWVYEVGTTTSNTLFLRDFSGDLIDPLTAGNGRIYLLEDTVGTTTIEDLYQSASPDH